jgi:arylsulfatase A-like enzyme
MRADLLGVALLFSAFVPSVAAAESTPPNIVWIIVDDMSANFSCYGEKTIQTPAVDRLAAEGTRYTRAFVTAPVCSACRSALITGCYQTTIGAQHHRSGRGELKIHLPQDVVPLPQLLQARGYYTAIGGPPAKAANAAGKAGKPLGKTDYNFEWDKSIYDGNDYAGRKPGQPFFMQYMLQGGKLRHNKAFVARAAKDLGSNTAANAVTLPPYYPRDQVLLDDWAEYLDAARYTDFEVAQIVERLKHEGLLDTTVIFFMTDHGISHARGKQFLYDEGIHVPLILRGPGIKPGETNTNFAQQIDLAPTTLALAGAAIPRWIQGRNLLDSSLAPREAVYSARDRCDETMEHMRSVRTAQYKYIRNYLHERPHLQPNAYKDAKPIVKRLRELYDQGKLDELQMRLLFAPQRAPEELYDLDKDPHELKNLATDPAHTEIMTMLRKRLADWENSTNDRGRTPESPEQYESDMAVYLGEGGGKDGGKQQLRANIELNQKWAKEGK